MAQLEWPRRYSEHMELHARSDDDGAWIVTLLGELDLAAVPGFRSATQEALRDGWTELVIDLQQVAFVDSAGIGVLIGLRRRIAEVGGSLTLRASGEVLRLLSVANVDGLFHVDTVGGEA